MKNAHGNRWDGVHVAHIEQLCRAIHKESKEKGRGVRITSFLEYDAELIGDGHHSVENSKETRGFT